MNELLEELLAEIRRRDVEYSWKIAGAYSSEVSSEYMGRRKELVQVEKDILKLINGEELHNG